MHWVATERSRNDGSKTQYYVVILDQLQGCSGALERAPEAQIRGPLTRTADSNSRGLLPGSHCCHSSGKGPTDGITLQMNFPQKITFDMLYTNEFLIRIRSRAVIFQKYNNYIIYFS